ncbi:MAG: hypothetical protein M3Y24_03155 [Acidobacteriota bacterium]|nr:hypothetical protein [Acidobacteriota bacterium]
MLLLLAISGTAYVVTHPPEIPFEKHTLDLGSSESAALADRAAEPPG